MKYILITNRRGLHTNVFECPIGIFYFAEQLKKHNLSFEFIDEIAKI